MIDNRTILEGDILKMIREIPDESMDVIVTSPPYYNLRSYDSEGQIGLEKTIPEYMAKIMEIMEECRRVTKKTGTIWINMGDSYAGTPAAWGDCDRVPRSQYKFRQNPVKEIRPKSRLMMPERFGVACVDSGFICRNVIPWVKKNTLPCSFKDRFQNTWEYVFFFSKEGKYYSNLDAVRVPSKQAPAPFNHRIQRVKQGQLMPGVKASQAELDGTNAKGIKRTTLTKQNFTPDASGRPKPTTAGFNERWRESREGMTKKDYVKRPDGAPVQTGLSFSSRMAANRPGQRPQTIAARHSGNFDMLTGRSLNDPKGKNPGDVFYINTTPLQTKCRNCSWKAADIREDPDRGIRYCFNCKGTELLDHHAAYPVELPHYILRFAAPAGGIVFDPFMGSGSTAVAAEKLGLKWCGIELNPDSILYSRKRLEQYKNEPLLEIAP